MAKRAGLILESCIILGYSGFLIFVLCSPDLKQPQFLKFPYSDKVIHASQFGILSFLLCRFFMRYSGGMSRFWIFSASVLITAAYGGAIEVIQEFVPGRVADIADAVANTVGAVLAASVVFLATAARKSRESAPALQQVSQKERIL